MPCKFRFVTLTCWIVTAAAILGFVGACSPEQYKAEADKEVYQVIDSKWQDGFGYKSNYIISDSNVPESPNDKMLCSFPSHNLTTKE